MSRLLAPGLAALAAGCAAPPPVGVPLPEVGSGRSDKTLQTAARFMVSAAHPLAVQAGVQVLQRGGSAVDATIAVQMVLTLVEPQASGIGGGAFALHWDGRTVQAWDGRETAPAAADEALFLAADGKPLPFAEAAVGGRPVGVPGVLRLLEQAHQQHGRRPWAELFEPAIT
ncbi:MAG: gamma-glutamyltransferase, partial [Burkholderiaceae bacterium]|nr:gamma-glutamyltransferase [Burkholderiaceae bacterium]